MAVLFSAVTLTADNNMRADADEEFLHDHCDNIEDVDFTIQWSPDELYGVELEL